MNLSPSTRSEPLSLLSFWESWSLKPIRRNFSCLPFSTTCPKLVTGDLNYVYKQYVTALSNKATDDMVRDLPFGEEIKEFIEEYERGESLEARLAHDADQLDLLLTLKMELDMGNRYAQDWIPNLLKRLQTTHGKELAQRILERDHKDWWFRGHDHWWEKK